MRDSCSPEVFGVLECGLTGAYDSCHGADINICFCSLLESVLFSNLFSLSSFVYFLRLWHLAFCSLEGFRVCLLVLDFAL